MKKILVTILALALFSLFSQNSIAQDEQPIAGEKVKSFDVEIKTNHDASVNVTETIVYDFGPEQKHGIFRFMPYKYRRPLTGNYKVEIDDVSVTNESGQKYNFEESRQGDNVKFKIGDANKFVTGEKTYVINYTIKKAINYFDDHDEFYWNVTGNEWPVEIERASAKVVLANDVEGKISETVCYAGFFGSEDSCLAQKSGGQDAFFSHQGLFPGDGLTIAIALPKGALYEPTLWEKFLMVLKDNYILFLPLATFGFLLYLWNTHGKDPEGQETIIAQFDAPDDLTPAEVGTIIDEKANNKDVSAEIISLAVRGYLKITKLEKKFLQSQDYELEKLKENASLVKNFDQKLMDSLFGSKQKVKLSSLKNSFYKDLKDIKKQLYEGVVKSGYFPKNPNTVRGVYLGIGIAICFSGFLFGIFWGFPGIFASVSSGIIVVIFSFFMPAKTKKGMLAKEHILGLKTYLTVAEKDRINFHNAPEKNPKQFEKFLPFAMALSVEQAWAKQFEDIYKEAPDWYNDESSASGVSSTFSAMALTNSLSNFATTANSNLSSHPSSAGSGGSGFSGGGSGGGFGGGGGGSW